MLESVLQKDRIGTMVGYDLVLLVQEQRDGGDWW